MEKRGRPLVFFYLRQSKKHLAPPFFNARMSDDERDYELEAEEERRTDPGTTATEAEADDECGESDAQKLARRSRRTKRKRRAPSPSGGEEDEEAFLSNCPLQVKAAMDVYRGKIDDVKKLSKELSALRKPVTEAANVIKSWMNEEDLTIVRVGKTIFRRKKKNIFKCDPKRFEMSDCIPESIKNRFIRKNTVKDDPSFQVK